MPHEIRNVAIIAHVDHGKTTLVDALLRQSGVFRANQQVESCVMDSLDLERERGITILSKNTAVEYQGVKINIVDTPGHADFSGEVERVLGMVDGALLIVDAFEGPMPQTRYVLQKALEQGLKPLVVVNKIDRPGCRPVEVVDLVLDLFIDLGADDTQIEFPVVFASGISGTATMDIKDPGTDMRPLFEAILRHVPAPQGDREEPLQFLVTTLDYSDYLGRIVIGRVHHGRIEQGQNYTLLEENGSSRAKVAKLFTFSGLKRLEAQVAEAGDIVAIAGFGSANIGDTIAGGEEPRPLPRITVDEPTLQMTFSVNDSPFCGREGKYVTSRHLRERLSRELQSNVALRVEETDSTDSFLVSGRGELHLGILVETMRREGYEFQISKPHVITKTVNGHLCEPYEDLTLDLPDSCTGMVIEALGRRRGEMKHMQSDGSRTQLEFHIPARGLLGFRSDFIRMTRGMGIMSHSFAGFRHWAGDIGSQRNGVLVAWEEGEATGYALSNLEDRGIFFIRPGIKVYGGMIVGEHTRQTDLEINVCKAKKLTNMRAASGDELVRLQTPQEMTLERAMEYINEDELIEVTPDSVRLRKQKLKVR